jgi:hypothetical protein
MKKRNSIAWKITGKLCLWMLILVVGVSVFFFNFTLKTMSALYAENFHNKMLITYEYTRRVLSDVYVSVTNNIFYIENSLDKPDGHIDVMERIVRHGTRVHSCGINFIADYYPQKGHKYCPFAWRNPANREEIKKEEKGDADFDYLESDWFRTVIDGDTAKWSDPFYDGYDNKTALAAYMVPIHDTNGKAIAVLGADISLDWLTEKLAETDSAYNATGMIASDVLGLKSQSFIINRDGRFMTHPVGSHVMKGVFYNYIKPVGNLDIEVLAEKLRTGTVSEKESEIKYLFEDQECYLFFTPLKYTDWMMVSVVPCQSIDMLGITYGLEIIGVLLLAMLTFILLNFYFVRRGTRTL